MNDRLITSKNNAEPDAGPIFLVLERDHLVAEDMLGTLRHLGPCRAIHLSSPDELFAYLQDGIQISAAFLEMRLAQLIDSPILQPLIDRGARIVLTVGEDDADRAEAQGWRMLARPFTDLMIRDILAESPKATA
ncbi:MULTISPECIES: hypothetical protein [unclassified Meridianimarinicoccus]|uniref:hypothetical protein n=1 Tax=unclassified Meridianimarinicoccus TaxID=2923344 RepID=UPI0018684C4D|nr:hypothetical protein [Fluviibacterium sp. MJW13]